MLEAYFQGIVITSLIGAVCVLVLLLLKPLTQKVFGATWHYYIWLVALAVMLLPIRLNLPRLEEMPKVYMATVHAEQAVKSVARRMGIDIYKMPQQEIVRDEYGHRLVSPHLQEARDREIVMEMRVENNKSKIVTLWLSVASLLWLIRIGKYVFFLRMIHKTTREVSCPCVSEYTQRKVRVRIGKKIGSPLLFGVFKPTLLLPDMEMTEEQLHNVLAHEMTHLKRNDMLYKWLVVLAKCIHWYNPAIYLISAYVNQECEISCDITATEGMSNAQRMSYVDTILALFANRKHADYALTMGMASSKALLKKRFMKMKNRIEVSHTALRWSKAVAAILLVCVMIFSGRMAEKAFPDLECQNLMPAVSRCTHCGREALFEGRQLASQAYYNEVLVYYAYHYGCDDCNRTWSRRQEVSDRYVIKKSYQTAYSVVSVRDVYGYSDPAAKTALRDEEILVMGEKVNHRELLKMVDRLVEEAEDSRRELQSKK